MDQTDRLKIKTHFIELAENINLSEWIPHVKTQGLFTQAMIQDYMGSGKSDDDKKRKIILDIPTRGPDAMEKFIQSLISAKQYKAARILRPNVDCPDGKVIEKTYSEPIDAVDVKSAAAISSKKLKFAYEVTSNPKGFALLIVNEMFDNPAKYPRRAGAQVDLKLWTDLFTQLDYKIVPHENLNYEEMEKVLVEFSMLSDHKNVHSCIIAISSHGEKDTIVCSDSELYSTKKIFNKFNNLNCPQLTGRPKMFFIQACRGGMIDDGTPKDRPDSKLTAISIVQGRGVDSHIPTFTDMIIAYSSIDEYVSFHNSSRGSWFVQIMTRVFMENACEMHLDDMLKIVQQEIQGERSIDGEKQMCEIVLRGWSKNMYFNP